VVCGMAFLDQFLHLTFLNGLLALVLWPYGLGVYFGTQKVP